MNLRPETVFAVALIVPGGSPAADPARLPAHQVIEADLDFRLELEDEGLGRFDNFMVVQNCDILKMVRCAISPARALWDARQGARVSKVFSFHKQAETEVFEEPILIIAGRQDSMSGYLDAIEPLPQFSRATLAVLDAAGHELSLERPELFYALVADWLRRVGGKL